MSEKSDNQSAVCGEKRKSPPSPSTPSVPPSPPSSPIATPVAPPSKREQELEEELVVLEFIEPMMLANLAEEQHKEEFLRQRVLQAIKERDDLLKLYK